MSHLAPLASLPDRLFSTPLSAPSVWGKLPAYGDFVQQNARAEDMAAWQYWFERHPLNGLSAHAIPVASTTRRPHRPYGWLSLDISRRTEDAHPLPWCFVLPAGTLPATPNLPADRIIAGVAAQSCDKVGRLHPMVIWHSLRPNWLDNLAEPRNWLYWMAQLLHYHTPPWSTQEHPNTDSGFLDKLNALWATARPTLKTRFRATAKALPETSLAIIIAQAMPPQQGHATAAALAGLAGVRQPPWSGWPHSAGPEESARKRQGYFWQQSANGEYVGLAAFDVGRNGGGA